MLGDEALNFDYLLKYIIIGDANVGKSNLLLRFAYGQFREEYQVTIGVEFGAKNLEIQDKIYRIQIWDTTGQEHFRSITRNYYKCSACALLVYDVTKKKSFDNITSWIEECKSQTSKKIFLVLVGNKIDLEEQREVTTEEGQELAEKLGIKFYEASAKTGDNVKDIFYNSADEIAKKIEENYYDLETDDCGIKKGTNKQNKQSSNKGGGKVQLGDGQTPPKKKCCK